MTPGKIFLIVGEKKSYCFIKDETGQMVFAHKSVFQDPDLMVKGANVKFLLKAEQKGKRPEATDVQAA